jgi:hypothetical protein
MKTLSKIALLAGAGALVANHASANLIVNGDFSAGNTGFTSGYGYTSVAGGLATGGEGAGEGLYAIGTNPNFYHSAFVTQGDHTTGTGNMMIVNGSGVANKTVWSGTVAPPLTVGAEYQFTAWVMNVYPDSPANLKFSFGGNSLGTFSPTGNGVWQEFTANFIATADQSTGLVDLNLVAFGNDFALDDLSLVAVPEPTTIIAGALLLLPFAASTVRIFRKARLA